MTDRGPSVTLESPSWYTANRTSFLEGWFQEHETQYSAILLTGPTGPHEQEASLDPPSCRS
jgi:hypothetical protein